MSPFQLLSNLLYIYPTRGMPFKVKWGWVVI